jgi:hypothetical protein
MGGNRVQHLRTVNQIKLAVKHVRALCMDGSGIGGKGKRECRLGVYLVYE